MPKRSGSSWTAEDGSVRMPTPAEWHEGVYGKRLGGAEYYKPGAPGRENPKRMARSYFLLMIREVAPQVLSELQGMAGLLGKVMQAEQERWDAMPPEAKGSAVEIAIPARATFADWIYDYFVQLRDGYSGALIGESEALNELVRKLVFWAGRYKLADWMVEDYLPALYAAHKKSYPDLDFATWVGHPSQGSQYPFEPQRVEYGFSAFGSPVSDDPQVVEDTERWQPSREFVFRFEGYDPTLMTRCRFEKFIQYAFDRAVQHYAEELERNLEAIGFQKCPEFHDTEIFEIAVERFCLNMTREEVAAKHGCKVDKVDKAVRSVAKLIEYRPENLERKQRPQKKSRRIYRTGRA